MRENGQNRKFNKKSPLVKNGKPFVESAFEVKKENPDEFDLLLSRSSYWRTIRVTAWVVRFFSKAKASKQVIDKTRGPLTTKEIEHSKECWVKRVQGNMTERLQAPRT